MNGWQRLLLVFSGFWVVAVCTFATFEYIQVSYGESPKRFIILKDINTGRTYGRLSYEKITRLGELTLKRSESAEAKPDDAERAREILDANPASSIKWSILLLWCLVPVLLALALYLLASWVLSGFRDA